MFKKLVGTQRTNTSDGEHQTEAPPPAYRVFTLNWQLNLDEPSAIANDIALHAVTEEHALASYLAVEIQCDADKRVIGVAIWENGKTLTDSEDHLIKKWQGLLGSVFPVPEKVNTLYDFYPESSSKMPHRMGGKLPDGLVIPSTRNPAGLQYVATFTSKAGILPDWEAPLHVLCPLFAQYFDRLDLDYTNPLAPAFVDQTAFEKSLNLHDINYDDIKNPSQIRYAAKHLVASVRRPRANTSRRDAIGSAGAPVWSQNPSPPKCPRTGDMMTFLAQIDTFHDQNVVGKPFEKLDLAYRNGFKTLNFWGSGTLYVFYHPESKIVTTLVQST